MMSPDPGVTVKGCFSVIADRARTIRAHEVQVLCTKDASREDIQSFTSKGILAEMASTA